MKTVIMVSDRKRFGIWKRFLKVMFDGDLINFSNNEDYEIFLRNYKPDLVLLHLTEPVDEGNMMGMHRHSNINNSLRVLIFNSEKVKAKLFNNGKRRNRKGLANLRLRNE